MAAEKILAFRIDIEGVSKEAEAIANIDIELSKLNQERREALNLSKKQGEDAEKYRKKLSDLTSRTTDLKNQKAQLNKVERASSREMRSTSGSMDQLRARTSKLRAEINSLDLTDRKNLVTLRKKKAEILANTKKIRDFDRSISGSSTLVGEYERGFVGAFKNIAAQITAVIAVWYTLNRVVGSSVNLFGEFEQSITNVQTLLDEQTGTLKKDSIRIMREYGLQIQDTNKAMFDAISAGVDTGDSYEFMSTAAKLAIGGVTDLSTSVDGLTSIINAYGLETKEAEKVAAAFFSSQKKGKTTVQELSDNIGKSAPIARMAGVSYQELLSTYAELTKNGLSTADANTVIKGTILAIIKPSEQAQKKFKELGIQTGLTAVRNQGLFNILTKIQQAVREDADALTELIPNVEALTGVGALGEEQLKDFHEILDLVNKDFGDGSGLMKAYEEQMGTTMKQIDLMKARLREVKIKTGEKIAPGILGLAELFFPTEAKEKGTKSMLAGIIDQIAGEEPQNQLEMMNDHVETLVLTLADLAKEQSSLIQEEKRASLFAMKPFKINETRRELQQLTEYEIPAYREALKQAIAIQAKMLSGEFLAPPGEEGGGPGKLPAMIKIKDEDFTKAEKALQLYLDREAEMFMEASLKELEIEQNRADQELERYFAIQEYKKRMQEEYEKWKQEKRDREVQAEEDARQRMIAAAQAYLSIAGNYVNTFSDMFANAKKRELEAAGDNAQKREQIEREYARKEKAMAVTKSIINTAVAITQALPNLFMVALVGVLGAIQTATILAQKFATGGRIKPGFELPGAYPGTDNTLILATPGEVILNREQQRRIGGDRTLKRIGVPGYATGGVIGGAVRPLPDPGGGVLTSGAIQSLTHELKATIGELKVVLNIHELHEAEDEVKVITQTSGV